jgi:Transposase zinc-ribbon domain
MAQRKHPKPVNIREINIKLATEEQCLQYIEQMRWPDGIVRCPTCGDTNVKQYQRPTEPKRKARSEDRPKEKHNRRQWFFWKAERAHEHAEEIGSCAGRSARVFGKACLRCGPPARSDRLEQSLLPSCP